MLKYVFVYIILFFHTFVLAQNKREEIDSIEVYTGQNELIKAINYAKNKTSYLLAAKKYEEYCLTCIRKSNIYSTLNDNEKALTAGYNALSIAEKHKLGNIKTNIYINIAENYAYLYDTIRSKKYYYKALSNGEKHNDLSSLRKVYQNFFRLYYNKNLDSAYHYMLKKFEIDKNLKDEDNLAISYNNFYAYYDKLNDRITAKKYLDSSWQYAKKSNIITSIVTTGHNMGYYYLINEQDYNKGISILKNIEKEYLPHLNNFDKIDLYSTLAYGYEEIKDYKSANYYNNLLIEIKDQIYEEGLKSKIRNIETKYTIDKLETEYITKQKTLEEKQIKNQKIIFVFVALFAFSLILFYFFYQNLQLKQRNKIKELDNEVKENLINASIDGMEIERKKLASVLHDNISALLSSVGLQLSAHIAISPTPPSEEIIKARAILKEAHDKVRDLSHELIPPVLAKLGLYYAVQDLCEKNSTPIIQFSHTLKIDQNNRYDEDFEIKVYYILAELVNNIIKHSQASKAHIMLIESNGVLEIDIQDNGKGFDDQKNYNNDGFGLTQIKARVKNLNGTITINSKFNVGSFIAIKVKTLPLSS